MSSKKGSQEKQVNKSTSQDLLDKTNLYFEKNKLLFLITALFLTSLFSLLLFDIKISVGGDDSGYIMKAIRLVDKGIYPTYQGPFYPIVLGVVYMITGLNLIVMKTLSFIFLFGFFLMLYKTYKNRIPNYTLFATIILCASCGYLIQYTSLTYNEPLYLLIQITFFWFFFKYFIAAPRKDFRLKSDAWKYIVMGLFVILISTTRKIGIVIAPTVGAYFLVEKRWKELIASIVGIGLIYFLYYDIIQFKILNLDPDMLKAQQDQVFNKDPYNASKGKEDFWGYIDRFIGNSNQYLSYHMFKFLGLRPDSVTAEDKNVVILTLLAAGALIGSFFKFLKTNKYLLFTAIYCICMMSATFIILQIRWNQERMVLIYFPYFLMLAFGLIYSILKSPKRASLQFISLILPLFFLLSTFGRTWSHSKEQFTSLRKNLKGDIYNGYTPDWENFLKMSAWVGKNIPQDQFVGSRKPTMSAIYAGGREFYGMYRVESENPDTLVDQLIKADVDYIIMASLRKIPNKKTQYTINTVQRYLYYMSQKYPNIAQQVHQVGVSEPAYLFKLNYPPERVKAVQAEQNQGK